MMMHITNRVSICMYILMILAFDHLFSSIAYLIWDDNGIMILIDGDGDAWPSTAIITGMIWIRNTKSVKSHGIHRIFFILLLINLTTSIAHACRIYHYHTLWFQINSFKIEMSIFCCGSALSIFLDSICFSWSSLQIIHTYWNN